jgi:hypothetical protein
MMTIDCRITIKISPRPITLHFHDFFIEHFLGYLIFFSRLFLLLSAYQLLRFGSLSSRFYCHMMMKVYSIGYSRCIFAIIFQIA